MSLNSSTGLNGTFMCRDATLMNVPRPCRRVITPSLARSLSAVRRVVRLTPMIRASSSSSTSGVCSSAARSRAMSARSTSDWLLTETYSPAAIDSAPAARPAIPASRTCRRSDPAAATPAIIEEIDTIPSFAPRTAARSQPVRVM